MSSGEEHKEVELSAQLTSDKNIYKRNEAVRLSWIVTNHSPKSILLLSHYTTTERRHFDYLSLDIVRKDNHQAWKLPLFGPRKAGAKVACLLRPGEKLRQEIHLTDWLKQQQKMLGEGVYEVSALYQVGSNESDIRDWVDCQDIKSADSAKMTFLHGTATLPWQGSLRSNLLVLQFVK